jgi:hypothetical protein
MIEVCLETYTYALDNKIEDLYKYQDGRTQLQNVEESQRQKLMKKQRMNKINAPFIRINKFRYFVRKLCAEE